MREILFRGKSKDTGEWMESLTVLKPDNHMYMCKSSMCEITYDLQYNITAIKSKKPFFVEVIPETVGQYTGLNDKNGIRIFEGDVVEFQFDKDDCSFSDKDTKKRIGRVYFEEFRASFAIAMGRNGSSVINNDLFKYVQNGNRVSVIGNIHDNPELFEKKE